MHTSFFFVVLGQPSRRRFSYEKADTVVSTIKGFECRTFWYRPYVEALQNSVGGVKVGGVGIDMAVRAITCVGVGRVVEAVVVIISVVVVQLFVGHAVVVDVDGGDGGGGGGVVA